jgi:hypothetical protein
MWIAWINGTSVGTGRGIFCATPHTLRCALHCCQPHYTCLSHPDRRSGLLKFFETPFKPCRPSNNLGSVGRVSHKRGLSNQHRGHNWGCYIHCSPVGGMGSGAWEGGGGRSSMTLPSPCSPHTCHHQSLSACTQSANSSQM